MPTVQHFVRADDTQTVFAPTSLIARVGDPRHMAACFELLEQSRFIYGDAVWRALPEMFRTLLKIGAMQLCLVEDKGASRRQTIVAFCASIFVADAFCREVLTELPPYLGLQVALRFQKNTLPVLDHGQIVSANSKAGVSVMTCYCGTQCDSLVSEHVFAVREKMAEAFRLAHQGYKLREVMCAPIGEETLRWALDAGFRLRRDYSEYYHAANPGLPEAAQRPWLVGLTKEEALADYGSRASGLFVFTAPRFHFNSSEQAILRRSLAGDTDEEMASNLAVSPWTVKKRWQSVYQRVANVDRELLPPADKEMGTKSRGVERRRHLVAYLRQHLEELRP
jgi:DNA-binding CsgD family transcriptional regulator